MKHNQIKLALFALFIGLFLTFSQTIIAQSALDGFDPNVNGTIRAIVVQPDGKILIGGDFTMVQGVVRNRIARLNPDGTLDTAFDPNANGFVLSFAVQMDGKILVGGGFTTIGGQPRFSIARLDINSGLADSFNPNANGNVYTIAVQSDGRIFAGGTFTTIGGQPRISIARLDANSGMADSFNPNANGNIFSIAMQPDGKILAGGYFTTIGGQSRNYIARLDANSGMADSFDPNANNYVDAIAVQSDGKILAGGIFTNIGGQSRNYIARLDANSGMADSFNPNANNSVNAIVVQSDGKILAGGYFTTIGGQSRSRIARLDANSSAADSFDPNTDNNYVNAIAVQSDGKILAGGLFNTIGGQPRSNIARLERDGRVDQTLNISTVGNHVLATAIQPDGKIIIGGLFTNVLGTMRNNIARLNADGTLDTTFNPNANGSVYSIVVEADGRILLGGAFTTLTPNGGAASARNRAARINTDGSLDTAFDPSVNGSVYSIVVQTDGKILLSGLFSTLTPNGGTMVTRNYIARINADGTLDLAFNPNANNIVYSIVVQSDGRILLGGQFTTLTPNGGAAFTRNRAARINTDGSLDTTFDPNANNTVYSTIIQADGRILLGGQFTTLAPSGGATVTRNCIARLNPDGTLDTAFNPNATGIVDAIAVQADGKILAGGFFITIGGQSRNYIARLDANSGIADSFNPNANNSVNAIAVQADGKILVGGNFSSIGGQTRNLFARLSNGTTARSTLTVTQTTIALTRDGSAPQFTRVIFEQSTNNGATYTMLGTATNSRSAPAAGKGERFTPDAPTADGYTLTGLNLPTGQNILIRARGFYRTGFQSGSETIEDKAQIAYLLAPTAAEVSIGGRVFAPNGRGLSNAVVHLTDQSGNNRTVQTNAFGYYNFSDLEAGQSVIMTVISKRYQFLSQVVNLTDNLSGINFIGESLNEKVEKQTGKLNYR